MNSLSQSDVTSIPKQSQIGRFEVPYVLSLFFIANVSNYADRQAVAALAPFIKADLGISDTELGVLTGVSFAFFYAVCGIPMARFADRYDRRNLLAWSLGVWSVMTALCGAASNFWQMLVARFGVGAGEAGLLPVWQTMVCDYLPLERRAAGFSFVGLGAYAGIALGLGIAGYMGEAVGWRWTFLLFGIVGIPLALVFRFTVREPRRGQYDKPPMRDKPRPLKELIAILWRSPSYRLLVIFFALNGFAYSSFAQWWPSYFNRVYAMDMASVGFYLGVVASAGSVLGVLGGGLLTNFLMARHRLALIWVPFVAILCAAPAALAALYAPSAAMAVGLVTLVNFLLGVPSGPTGSAIYAVCPVEDRASAGAILFFATAIFGLGLGPLTVGIISDIMSQSTGAASLRPALLLPTVALVLMAIALGCLLRTFPRFSGNSPDGAQTA